MTRARRALRLAEERPAIASVALLTLLTAAVFHRQLFDGWTFPWDFAGKYSASPAFVAAVVGRGEWTEWTPFVSSGHPLAADLQSGLYYPLWWALGIAGVPLTLGAMTTIQVVHVLLGVVGALVLGRVRGFEWKWALIAAVAYLFFGGFYGNAEHSDILRGLALAPWLLVVLTPPTGGRPWTRIAGLPLVAWLAAAGAYPGQLIAFSIAAAAYVGVELWRLPAAERRRHLVPLFLAAGASLLVSTAIVLPYAALDASGDLHRVYEPTPEVRAHHSFHPVDLWGLYLNSFAWSDVGPIVAWTIGIPTIVGLACLRRGDLARQAPLAVAGLVALLLATVSAWETVARATDIPVFASSRFPASDYKAFVGLAAALLGAYGWRAVAEGGVRRPAPVGALVLVLVAGIWLVPEDLAEATRAPLAVIAVALLALVLMRARMPAAALACALLALVVVDGVRTVRDMRHEDGTRPWGIPASRSSVPPDRDSHIRQLDETLAHPPAVRPRRVPPAGALDERSPIGTPPDSTGYSGSGYHLVEYGGTITRARWDVQSSQVWTDLALRPWTAWTFPCQAPTPCDGRPARLPAPSRWPPGRGVRTVHYGTDKIVYEVSLARPALMAENELSVEGWSADRADVRRVDTGTPFRAWTLPAGSYRFTASYREPQRPAQIALAASALLVWLGLGAWLRYPAAERNGHRTRASSRL